MFLSVIHGLRRQQVGAGFTDFSQSCGPSGPHSGYPRVFDPDDPEILEAAHTGINVPLFAAGLALPLTRGTIDNTEVYALIKQAFPIP